MLREGQVLAGHRVLRLVGEGATGQVYAVVPIAPDGPVRALKLLREEHLDRPDLVARFLNEAIPVRDLRHPGIVQVFACEMPSDGPPYLLLELLDESLTARVKKGSLPVARSLGLGAQLGRTLSHIHQAGLVHRDVKPANVLLIGEQAKLGDFGLAKFISSARQCLPVSSADDDRLGTPAYMAPELWLSAKAAGPPADVYSLGVLLFELLDGAPPFAGPDEAALRRQHLLSQPRRPGRNDLPEGTEQLLRAMMDKRPADRPTALAAARRLDALVRAARVGGG